jgi:hypothetical protein
MDAATPWVTILVTTDGSRPHELAQLLASVAGVEGAQVVLALQNGAPAPILAPAFKPKLLLLEVAGRVSLSEARNRMLDALEASEGFRRRAIGGHVFFADDDCWYADGFFDRLELRSGAHLFATVDPESGRTFTAFALANRSPTRPLARWELMFYAVAIAFAVPYVHCQRLRFHPDLGLGARVSQGEESQFLFEICRLDPAISFSLHPDRLVFHPWKRATDERNHRALSYFLGWSLRQCYWHILPFYAYLVSKYAVASVVRRDPLYRAILKSLLHNFVLGLLNTKQAADLPR